MYKNRSNCVYVYVYIYIYIYVCVCVCACACAYVHVHTHTGMCWLLSQCLAYFILKSNYTDANPFVNGLQYFHYYFKIPIYLSSF